MGHITSSWTYAISYVRLLAQKGEVATASAFFWRRAERSFLITNWHCLSGINPRNGSLMFPGGRPDEVVASVLVRSNENAEGWFEVRADVIRIGLVEPGTGAPTWIEHAQRSRNVDIAAVDVTDVLAAASVSVGYANETEDDADVEPRPSQDIFILGYPLGLVTQFPLPVWKRGSIASEPLLDLDDSPMVLVDSATRQGMSGALVIARHVLVGGYGKRDGSREAVLYAVKDRILGVYSGRLDRNVVEAQIGVVWKRYLIDELVNEGIRPRV